MAAGVPRATGESGHFYFGESGHFYLGTTAESCHKGHSRTKIPLVSLSIGEDCKTHVPARLGLGNPGVCLRVVEAASSEVTLAPVALARRRNGDYGSFSFGVYPSGGRAARQCLSGRALHRNVGTILPSGPRSGIASFGSSEGHSLCLGPSGRMPEASRFMDTHLRTVLAFAPGGDSSIECPPSRAVAYTPRSVVIDRRIRSGWYSSSCFPMHNTVAAIVRATVSLARFGLVPASSICS